MGNKTSSSSKNARRDGYWDNPPPYSSTYTAGPAEQHKKHIRTDSTYLREPLRQESFEDALELLKNYDTILVVDDSGSMAGARWREAEAALRSVADIALKYDSDGIDIHFFNSKRFGKGVKSSAGVERLFSEVSPAAGTPMGAKIEQLLLEELEKLEKAKNDHVHPDRWKQIKPVNYIIITDGAPTDDPESVIVAAARRLDRGNFPLTQIGIQFVQLGSSTSATRFLQELDNDLQTKHDIRDIVDTTPYLGTSITGDMIIKILIGGINRRVDRKGHVSI